MKRSNTRDSRFRFECDEVRLPIIKSTTNNAELRQFWVALWVRFAATSPSLPGHPRLETASQRIVARRSASQHNETLPCREFRLRDPRSAMQHVQLHSELRFRCSVHQIIERRAQFCRQIPFVCRIPANSAFQFQAHAATE